MSLSGVKRTWPIAVQMSANDPKRTSGVLNDPHLNRYDVPVRSLGSGNAAARLHRNTERHGAMATCGARAAGVDAGGRFLKWSVARFRFPPGSDVQPSAERSRLR